MDKMNQLIDYLFGRMGKKTCPIISVEHVFDVGFNNPWKEYVVIKFKDGTTLELVEKPEMK